MTKELDKEAILRNFKHRGTIHIGPEKYDQLSDTDKVNLMLVGSYQDSIAEVVKNYKETIRALEDRIVILLSTCEHPETCRKTYDSCAHDERSYTYCGICGKRIDSV